MHGNHDNEQGELQKSYDTYFEDFYTERNGDEANARATYSAMESAKNSLEDRNSNSICYVDFGCGNGRFHHFAEKLSHENNAETKVKVIAFDVSLAGLKQYEQKLKDSGYLDVGGGGGYMK